MEAEVDAHLERIAALTDETAGRFAVDGERTVVGVGEVASPEIDADSTHVGQEVCPKDGIESL